MQASNQHAGGFPLLVLGMHRSGTSLLAGLLHQAGVSMGDSLLPPEQGNPRGLYEDSRYVKWHEALLAHNRDPDPDLCGSRWLLREPPPRLDWEKVSREAKAAIPAPSARAAWGWKDPRSLLFLEEWFRRYPEARGILVFRHPLEVYASFIRRGDWAVSLDPSLAFDSYRIYYQSVLPLLGKMPARFFVVEANALLNRWDDKVGQLMAWAGIEFDSRKVRPEPDGFKELQRGEGFAFLEEALPSSMEEYRSLREWAGGGQMERVGKPPLSRKIPETKRDWLDKQLSRTDLTWADGGDVQTRRMRVLRELPRRVKEDELANLNTALRVCHEQLEHFRRETGLYKLEFRNLSTLRKRVIELEQQLWKSRKTIEALKSTFSWKLTRPLRTVRDWMKSSRGLKR